MKGMDTIAAEFSELARDLRALAGKRANLTESLRNVTAEIEDKTARLTALQEASQAAFAATLALSADSRETPASGDPEPSVVTFEEAERMLQNGAYPPTAYRREITPVAF